MYKHHPNIHSHIHNTQYLILCIQIYRHFLILRLKLQKYLIECLNINSLMNKVRSTGNYRKWPIKQTGRLFSNKNVWVGACLDSAFNWTYELIKKIKNKKQKTTKSFSQVNFSRNAFQNWSQKSFYSFRLKLGAWSVIYSMHHLETDYFRINQTKFDDTFTLYNSG